MTIPKGTLQNEPSDASELPFVTIRSPWGQVPEHYWTYVDPVHQAGTDGSTDEGPLASRARLGTHPPDHVEDPPRLGRGNHRAGRATGVSDGARTRDTRAAFP